MLLREKRAGESPNQCPPNEQAKRQREKAAAAPH